MLHQTGAHMIPTTTSLEWEFRVAKCLLDCVGKQFWQMAERRRHYSKCHVSASKELENRRAAHGGGKEMSTRVHQSNELSLLCLSQILEWEVCVCVSLGEWIRHVFNI